MNDEVILKAGIIGGGWVATARHIPALLKDDRVRITAVFDPNLEKAKTAAKRFGIPLATSKLDHLLNRAPDLVSICTPPASHASLTIKALEAGSHVMVEKPMAMTSVEAREMIGTAERTGLRLCVSHNLLFSRSVSRARAALIDAGPIQHIIGVQQSNPDRRLPTWYHELPGGLFFDESPHLIYLMRHLLGDFQVDKVWASLETKPTGPEFDVLETRISSDTASANLTMVFNAPVSDWTVIIIAARKVITLDLFRDMVTIVGGDGRHGPAEVMTGSLNVALQTASGFITSGARYSMNRLLYGHDRLISAFIDSIEGGNPAVDLADSLAVVETTETILAQAGIESYARVREAVA